MESISCVNYPITLWEAILEHLLLLSRANLKIEYRRLDTQLYVYMDDMSDTGK